MKNYILFRTPNSVFGVLVITMLAFVCWPNQSRCQSTNGNNNPASGAFIGFNGAQDLDFKTNNTTYMQLMQNGNSTINGFNIDRSGFWVEPGFNHPSLN